MYIIEQKKTTNCEYMNKVEYRFIQGYTSVGIHQLYPV